MLVSLSIHLHGLHLGAQYGQTRHLSTQLRSGERTGRRLLWLTILYCYRPYYPAARFRSPSWHIVSDEPFPDRSRPMSCYLAQMGSRPITFLWLWLQRQTMNHIVDRCPLTNLKVDWIFSTKRPDVRQLARKILTDASRSAIRLQ